MCNPAWRLAEHLINLNTSDKKHLDGLCSAKLSMFTTTYSIHFQEISDNELGQQITRCVSHICYSMYIYVINILSIVKKKIETLT